MGLGEAERNQNLRQRIERRRHITAMTNENPEQVKPRTSEFPDK
jgi:hypothetical protein